MKMLIAFATMLPATFATPEQIAQMEFQSLLMKHCAEVTIMTNGTKNYPGETSYLLKGCK